MNRRRRAPPQAIAEVRDEKSPGAIHRFDELLAVAEPVDLSNVHMFVSPQRAEQGARAAAACWIARLAPLLQAANVPYHAYVVIGNAPAEIEAALHRADVDRVVLPATAPRWSTAAPPVTVVA